MRTRRLVVTAVLVVAAGLAACSAPGPPNSRTVPKVASTTIRARAVASIPKPVRSSVSAPVRTLSAPPPSARLRLRYVTTIGGHISPKSVDASGTGLVFAQNMIYTHTVTVYNDRDYRLVATIPDAVTLRNWGYTQYPGRYLGGPVEAAFSPDRRYVYVSNYSMDGPALTRQGHDVCSPADDYDSSFVYRISVATMRIDQVIHVGSVPKFVAVTPDGRHLEKVKVTIKRILNESVRCRASSSCLSSRGESGTGPPGCLHVVNGGVPGAGRVRVPGGSHGPWCVTRRRAGA